MGHGYVLFHRRWLDFMGGLKGEENNSEDTFNSDKTINLRRLYGGIEGRREQFWRYIDKTINFRTSDRKLLADEIAHDKVSWEN